MEKNTAGKWVVFAFGLPDHANPNEAITGDAANITANVRIDGGAANAVDDTNPTELEDGYYIFDITAAEANGDSILLAPASSTANVQVIAVPGALWTTPANFPELGIASDGDLSGNVDGNVVGSVASVVGAVGSVTGGATSAAQTTAQTDLDTLTGSDGATLATAQGNYAPAKAGDNMGTVSSVTGNVDGSVASVTAAVVTDAASRTASKADVSGLSTFDPVNDVVANVTLVDTTTTNSDAITVSDIQTTQMTEAYAADGVAPTLAQAIFLIQQTIGDFAIAGTTITTKKLDGSTTAATYTLDDGTSPTSRTRST